MSPWHDVSLRNTDGTVNFVCEIPKDTKAKMEVATVSKGTSSALCKKLFMTRNLNNRQRSSCQKKACPAVLLLHCDNRQQLRTCLSKHALHASTCLASSSMTCNF